MCVKQNNTSEKIKKLSQQPKENQTAKFRQMSPMIGQSQMYRFYENKDIPNRNMHRCITMKVKKDEKRGVTE